MKEKTLGIIGNGFVGNAIYQNFKDSHRILIYDKDESRSTTDNVREVCHKTDIIFVALPTPMYENGRCDLSIILNVMAQISYWYKDNIVIIKSTVPPGSCESIKKRFPTIRLVFSPEFLTERNAVEDFRTCNRVIFGGEIEDIWQCVELFKLQFPDKAYLTTDWKTAEMVKYFLNTFLATKVSFANEIYQVCKAIDVSYDEVLNLALYDKRLTPTHFLVPGPDGQLGFGGVCFPKDLNAFINFCGENNVDPTVLTAVWNKNLLVRKNCEWLALEGRAISKKEK
jgi:UDPglucose 6-dehydrogenase